MAKQNWNQNRKSSAPGPTPIKKTRKSQKNDEASGSSRKWHKNRGEKSPSPISPRRIALAMLLVIIAFGVYIIIRNLQSPRNTPLILISDSTSKDKLQLFQSVPFRFGTFDFFETREFQGKDVNVFSLAASGDFPLDNLASENDLIGRLDSRLRPGGPDRNVFLFYLYSNGLTNPEGHPMLSSSRSDPAEFDGLVRLEDVLNSLQTSIKKSSGGKEVQAIVFLDCGQQVPGQTLGQQKQSFVRKTGEIIEKLNSTPDQKTRFSLLLSQSDNQKGWTASEFNGSVFGFFVAQGLAGWADLDKDQTITLKELSSYLKHQVRDWTHDFRDSRQDVQIFPSDSADGEIPIVFALNPVDPILVDVKNLKTDLVALWLEYEKLLPKLIDDFPLLLGQVEQIFSRLETLRFEPEVNPEYTFLYKQLETHLQEIGRLQVRKQSRSPISLAEYRFRFPGNLRPEDHFPALKRMIKQRLVGDTLPMGKEKAETSPQAIKADTEFANLDRIKKSLVSWNYLLYSKQEVSKELLTVLLEILDKPNGVEWVEVQFLRMLRDRIDWSSSADRSVVSRAIRMSISCRNRSEAFIQKFSRSSNSLISWSFVASRYAELEQIRRHYEDRLFAGQFQQSIDGYLTGKPFGPLEKAYEALQSKADAIQSAAALAKEALWITPHLWRFTQKEKRSRYSSQALESPGFSTLIESPKKIFSAITDSNTSFDFLTAGKHLSEQLKAWRQFVGSYAKLDKTDFKESEQLRIRLHLLATPLIEWLGQHPGESAFSAERSGIRDSMDRAIATQSTSIYSDRYWDRDLNNANDKPNRKADSNSESPFSRSLLRESVLSLSERDSLRELMVQTAFWNREQRKTYVSILDSIQNKAAKSGDPQKNLRVRQNRLLHIDWLNRNVAGQNLFGPLDHALDVGIRIRNLQSRNWNQDRLNRSLLDFWGSGLTSSDNLQNSPFVQYVQFYAGEFDDAHPDDQDWVPTQAFPTERINNLVAGLQFRFTQYNEKIGGALVVPFQSETTAVNLQTRLEGTESLTKELVFADPLGTISLLSKSGLVTTPAAIGNESLVPSRLHPISLKESAGTGIPLKMEVSTTGVQSDSASYTLRFAFRGHILESSLLLVRRSPAESAITSFTTTINPNNEKTSTVGVMGNAKELSDVILILDCSQSMNNAGRDSIGENNAVSPNGTSRLENAKTAIKKLLVQLRSSGRFRVGLWAFAHRSEYDETSPQLNGKYGFSNPKIHPFTDCEEIHSYQDSDGATPNSSFVKLMSKVDQIEKGKGFTPLYYSILKAAKVLKADSNKNPKQLVVVTDGVNFQGEGKYAPNPKGNDVSQYLESTIGGAGGGPNFSEIWKKNYSSINLHIVQMTPSEKPFSVFLREELSRLQKNEPEKTGRIAFKKIELDRYPRLLKWAKETENVTLMEAKDGDTDDVTRKLLSAVRFVKYSVIQSDRESTNTVELGDTIQVKLKSVGESHTIKMQDTRTPLQKSLKLFGGEKVVLDLSRTGGLKFRGFAEDFVTEFKNVSIGTSKYRIGRLTEKLEFGVENIEHSEKGTIRPQQIWFEVTPKTGLPNIQPFYVFDYRFKSEQLIPIIEIPDLGPWVDQLEWKTPTKSVDIRVWISSEKQANQKDSPQVTILKADTDYENIKGLKCSTQIEGNLLRVIITSVDGMPFQRQHALLCDKALNVKRTYFRKNKKLFMIKHEFLFNNIDPTRKPDCRLMVAGEIRQSKDDVGRSTDPFFGNSATWIRFKDVPIVE